MTSLITGVFEGTKYESAKSDTDFGVFGAKHLRLSFEVFSVPVGVRYRCGIVSISLQ